MSGASIVEFHIKAKEGARNAFTLEVFQRGSSQPLGNTSFDYDLSFLTEYDVSNLDSGKEEPGIRFEKLKRFGMNLYDRLFTKEIGDLWEKLRGRGSLSRCVSALAGKRRGWNCCPGKRCTTAGNSSPPGPARG